MSYYCIYLIRQRFIESSLRIWQQNYVYQIVSSLKKVLSNIVVKHFWIGYTTLHFNRHNAYRISRELRAEEGFLNMRMFIIYSKYLIPICLKDWWAFSINYTTIKNWSVFCIHEVFMTSVFLVCANCEWIDSL